MSPALFRARRCRRLSKQAYEKVAPILDLSRYASPRTYVTDYVLITIDALHKNIWHRFFKLLKVNIRETLRVSRWVERLLQHNINDLHFFELIQVAKPSV